ncbi:unnamed protein product, partial [Laminaria digitata]
MPAASTSIASRGVSASSFRGHSCAVSGRLRVVLLLVGGTLAVTLLLLLLLLPPPLLRNMGSLLHLQELGPAEQAQIYHSLAKDSVTTRTADGGYICRAVDESNGNKDCRAVAGEMLVEAGEESVRSRTAFANRNVGDTQAPRIPFFGNGNTESMRGAASHLDHRVDQYRQELVKVMQSLDLTVTGLEEAAAKVGTGGRDMPAQGVRRLAAKLKQKMDKTPPRWQVNTDVLSWLLRPVPFVAGLPAAAPTPPASSFSSTPPQDGGRDTSRAAASGDDTKDVGSVTELVEERRPAPFVHGGGATATLAEDLNGQEPGHRGGGGGEQGGSSSSNRAGFNSYEDIHQIFTHMVRDWTSEGDSVRAAVYDPLLQALDHWVGWQEGAAPAGAAPTATEAVPRSRGEIRARQRRRRGQPKPAARVRRPANVLVPGAGLGRLATEIAAREYASVHANELSMTMLSSCYWIMEALRSDTFSGPGPSSSMMPASEWDGGGSDSPWSRPPTADFMSDRNDDAGL